jgi:hypothetical protein
MGSRTRICVAAAAGVGLLALGAAAWAEPRVSGGDHHPAPTTTTRECLEEHGLGVDQEADTITLANKPVDLQSDAVRELMFVTCRPRFPDPADARFTVGFEPSEFVRCVRAQGFDLADPVQEGNAWILDLKGAGIDPNSDEWNRAAFVTCAPRIAPERE